MARILVLDDDTGVRTIIAQALKAAGHQVFSAANGREGTRHLGAIQPDLIIIDLFMPEQEGLETIKKLHDKFPHVAMLAISGGNITSAAMLSVALQLGATDSLEKPFDKDTLLAKVETALRTDSHSKKAYFYSDAVGPILPESD